MRVRFSIQLDITRKGAQQEATPETFESVVMRVRFSIQLDITRKGAQQEATPETFESQGSLVEMSAQPRYIGFTPEEL